MQPSPSRKRTLDQVSPSNAAAGYSSASPIPTAFSPAAMAGGLSGHASVGPGASPMGADSPFTSALNQGSRMLSGISAPTPPSGLPGYDPRSLAGYPQAQSPAQLQQMQFLQMQVQNGTMTMDMALQMANLGRPFGQQQRQQQIKPEVALKMSIDSLLEEVLPALERDGDAFYDALEASLDTQTDSRHVQSRRDQLLSSLANLVQFLQANGLASLPLKDSPQQPEADSNPTETLARETAELQELAREMFERRARLREAASIITGILNDDVKEAGGAARAGAKGGTKGAVKKTVTMALGPGGKSGRATPANASSASGTPKSAATPAVGTPSAAAR